MYTIELRKDQIDFLSFFATSRPLTTFLSPKKNDFCFNSFLNLVSRILFVVSLVELKCIPIAPHLVCPVLSEKLNEAQSDIKVVRHSLELCSTYDTRLTKERFQKVKNFWRKKSTEGF